MSITVLSGHVSPETAYEVASYPYGFTLRCKKRWWLEYAPKKGVRLVSQTTDPKRGHVWNKPKASTYTLIAAMYLDEEGHVQWSALPAHHNTAACLSWCATYGEGVPDLLKPVLDAFIEARQRRDAAKAQREAA